MRVRVTIEYDTEETLDYERQAWLNGDVGLQEFAALTGDDGTVGCDDTIKISFEEIPS